jgi:hypothetical protein
MARRRPQAGWLGRPPRRDAAATAAPTTPGAGTERRTLRCADLPADAGQLVPRPRHDPGVEHADRRLRPAAQTRIGGRRDVDRAGTGCRSGFGFASWCGAGFASGCGAGFGFASAPGAGASFASAPGTGASTGFASGFAAGAGDAWWTERPRGRESRRRAQWWTAAGRTGQRQLTGRGGAARLGRGRLADRR